MLMQRLAIAIAVAFTGCSEHAPSWYAVTDGKLSEATADASTSFAPVTSTDGGVATTGSSPTSSADSSTGGVAADTSTGDAGSSTGSPADAPPQVFAFMVETNNDTPGQIFEAGEVQLDLQVSDDVVEVDVMYGDTLVATVPIASFPYTFDITSQTMCDGSRTFTAIVRDAGGQTDMDTADLYCQLPAPGSEEYTRTYPGASGSGGAGIASLPDGSAIVAGVLDGRMALWRLDPEGNVAAGWPKTIAGWTELAAKESSATAVSVDATGAIFIGGTIKSGITTRRYLAKLSDKGERLWEDPGLKDGEEISSLATSVAGDTVAAGSVRTSPLDQEPAYDSGTWGYPKQGPRWSDVFMQPDTDPQPDDKNKRSERAHAVLALPDGDFMVFGEREYKDDDSNPYTRATAQRYTSDGARDGELWTSAGLKFLNDAAVAATLTDAGFTAAGWCRHKTDGAIRQVCVQEFDADGAWVGSYAEPSPMQAEARAVAQDREHKLVIGGFSTKPGQTDAWVFSSVGADKPLPWTQTYDAGGWDFASGVACDPWGHSTWVGTTITDGSAKLVVSRRNP
jgi:hypothetical protein